jgi:hypothetical protein
MGIIFLMKGLLGAAFLVPFGAVAKRDSRTYSVLTTKQ